MRSANLLRDTDTLDSSSNWTRSNITVTHDQADRDGTANRYYRLLRNGSASASIRSTVVSPGADGILTFSVDAKADTSAILRLGIVRADGSWAVSPDEDRPLDSALRRYAAIAYGLTVGELVKCYTYVGSTASTDTTTDAIIVGEPLATSGPVIHPFVETLAAQSGVPVLVPQRSLYVGMNVWTWGLAAPTTGYHHKGDRVFNSDPDSGEVDSWVCTAAGTPGTWLAVVTLGATPVSNPLARGDAPQARWATGKCRAILGASSTALFTSGDLVVVPFAVPPDAGNIASIGWDCTTLQAGSNCRFGVWADDGTGTLPANAGPLYDSGQISCASSGVKLLTIGASLSGRTIWIGGVTDGSGTMPTMRISTGYYPPNLVASQSVSDTTTLCAYRVAGQSTASALPTFPTSISLGSANAPRFLVNYA